MKKAKIMLTAVAVFAVVGGALAFKVRTPNTFYRTAANGQCTSAVVTSLTTTTTTTVPGAFTTRLATAPVAAPCPIITVRTTL